jgi:uncharacterized Zn finger protein (UPF0148 family)
MEMYCSNCGKELPQGAVSCPNCQIESLVRKPLANDEALKQILAHPIVQKLVDNYGDIERLKNEYNLQELKNQDIQHERNCALAKEGMEISERMFGKIMGLIKPVTLIVLCSFLLAGIGLIFLLNNVTAGLAVMGFVVTIFLSILSGEGIRSMVQKARETYYTSNQEDEDE